MLYKTIVSTSACLAKINITHIQANLRVIEQSLSFSKYHDESRITEEKELKVVFEKSLKAYAEVYPEYFI